MNAGTDDDNAGISLTKAGSPMNQCDNRVGAQSSREPVVPTVVERDPAVELVPDLTLMTKRNSRNSTSEEAPGDFTVVSMFSGCGGMDLGFTGGFKVFGRQYKRLPFRVVWANDLNKAACRTYRRNLQHDISDKDVWKVIDTIPTQPDVLVGGFPCQDISVNGKRSGVAGKRSGLYRAMVEAIKRTQPKVFVAENVKGLLMKYNEDSLEQVLADFGGLEYDVTYGLYRAADYGVPQTRERVFIVGTSKSVAQFIRPKAERNNKTWMTAREAIADLERVAESEEINHIWSRANRSPEQGNRRLLPNRPGYTIRAECHGNIQYHYSLPRRISMREAARFQSFPDSFIFDAKLRETERQVGNAVPPVLAWHIAKAVLRCLTTPPAADAPTHATRRPRQLSFLA